MESRKNIKLQTKSIQDLQYYMTQLSHYAAKFQERVKFIKDMKSNIPSFENLPSIEDVQCAIKGLLDHNIEIRELEEQNINENIQSIKTSLQFVELQMFEIFKNHGNKELLTFANDLQTRSKEGCGALWVSVEKLQSVIKNNKHLRQLEERTQNQPKTLLMTKQTIQQQQQSHQQDHKIINQSTQEIVDMKVLQSEKEQIKIELNYAIEKIKQLQRGLKKSQEQEKILNLQLSKQEQLLKERDVIIDQLNRKLQENTTNIKKQQLLQQKESQFQEEMQKLQQEKTDLQLKKEQWKQEQQKLDKVIKQKLQDIEKREKVVVQKETNVQERKQLEQQILQSQQERQQFRIEQDKIRQKWQILNQKYCYITTVAEILSERVNEITIRENKLKQLEEENKKELVNNDNIEKLAEQYRPIWNDLILTHKSKQTPISNAIQKQKEQQKPGFDPNAKPFVPSPQQKNYQSYNTQPLPQDKLQEQLNKDFGFIGDKIERENTEQGRYYKFL